MNPRFSCTLSPSIPLFLAAVAFAPLARAQDAPQPHKTQPARAHVTYRTPLRFEPNRGQAEAQTQFVAHGAGYSLQLNATTATFDLHKSAAHGRAGAAKPGVAESSAAIRMHLVGADDKVTMTPERALPRYVNYLSCNDASKFKTGIPTFEAARARQVYPGIDVVYYGNQRQLEYDFVVGPGSAADTIRFALQGATPKLGKDGELRLQVKGSADLSFHKPVLYQEAGGKRVPVDGSFLLAENGTVGFKVGAYDHARALTIDPIISYASYFGGTGEDEINGTTINSANQLYAVGQSYSTALPGTAGEFMTTKPAQGGHAAFVTKFSADGSTILWTTYLAGSQDDYATSVAVNSSDQAYVTGYTSSCKPPNTSEIGFPFTSDAVQALCNPNVIGFNNYESNSDGYDVFLAKLSSDGKTLLYSTPLGGSSTDVADSVVLDAAGKVYIVGETLSTQYQYFVSQRNNTDVPAYPVDNHGSASIGIANYPTTTNAFYSNTTESKQYATQDSSGNVLGPQDEQAFLTVLSADLHSLVYSSLIGGGIIGGCGNGACNTNGYAVAVNSKGIVYIGGNTSSAHWPVTAGAFAPTCSNAGQSRSQCPMTGWAAGFNPALSGAASLLFTTYINGTSAGLNGTSNLYPGSDVYGMTTDSAGNVILTGDTNADNFPTTSGVLQPTCSQYSSNGNTNLCNFDAFVTKLTATGATVWSTYFQGNVGSYSTIQGQGAAVDATGNVYVLMQGNAVGLPLLNSLSQNGAQSVDAFLLEMTSDAKTELLGTYLGSGGGIAVNSNSLHLDSNLNAYFGGWQGYNNYGGTYLPTTTGAADTSLQGNADGFVVKLITQQQPSATALAVSPTGAVTSSQTVTLTATITSASTLTGIPTKPTGTVTFMNGGTALGTAQAVNSAGVATFAGTYPNGSYSFTAVYSGDVGFNTSTSTPVSVTVSSAVATVTTATVAPAAASFGQSVVLTSTTTAGSAPATSGTITFMAGSTTLGTAPVGANGVASVTVTPAPGTYSVVASYAGTASASNPTGFGGSASAGTPLTVAKAADAVAFTATPTLAATGGTVMLKATVSTTVTAAAPSGTVNFLDGSTIIGSGTVTAGVAMLNTATLSAGTHVLSASYLGDTNYNGATATPSVTVTVRSPAATTTTLVSSSLAVNKGATVTLMATIGSTATTGSPSGVVTFFDGATTLGTGTVSGSTASFTTGALPSGPHSFTANYGGDTLFLGSVSSAVAVSVATPSLTVTASPNPLLIKRGSSGSTTLTLTPSGGFAGTISFGCGSLPNFVSCVFQPTTLTFTAASGPQTDVLTVYTTTQHAMLSAPRFFGRGGANGMGGALAMLLWLPGSALALCGLKRRGMTPPLRRMLLLSLLVFGFGGMAMLSGCAGDAFNTAAAGTTTVQVTVTSSDGSQVSTPITLTIQ